MSSASRAALRRKARSKHAGRNDRWFYAAIGVIVVAVAAVAILTADGSAPPSGRAVARETASVQVGGDELPLFESTEGDAAVGLQMPAISGIDFEGDPVAIGAEGRPKLVMFLAHWCPHCQVEVPMVQSWIEEGRLPSDVDLYAVSTAVDANMPNYPPSEWLERDSWTSPVVLDDKVSSAGRAVGVASYPFFVFVNADGTVAARAAGELDIPTIEGALAQLER